MSEMRVAAAGSFAEPGAPASVSPAQPGTLVQFARYLVVGGVAFAIDFATLAVLTEFAGMHYLISAPVAFLFGLIANYFLSRVWVFQQRRITNAATEFALFALIGLVGLALNEAIIWTITEQAHISYLLGKIASAGLVLIWNFGARKYLLFRDGNQS